MKYVAYYADDNQLEEFNTSKEAEDWLQSLYQEDGTDDGFKECSMNGSDFIAIKVLESEYREVDNIENYTEEEIKLGHWDYEDVAIGEIFFKKVS